MARKVKCYVTNESGTSDVFVKKNINSSTSKYFKSEEVYSEWLNSIKEKKIQTSELNEVVKKYIFQNGIVPPVFINRLSSLGYENYKLIQCIKQNESAFEYANKKDFYNFHQKIGYLIAIIKNTIDMVQDKPVQSDKELFIEEIVDEEIKSKATNKRKDITKFLED